MIECNIIQGTFRCSVERHGLDRTIGDKWMAGLNDLVDIFQPWWFHDHHYECRCRQKMILNERTLSNE